MADILCCCDGCAGMLFVVLSILIFIITIVTAFI